MSEKYLIL